MKISALFLLALAVSSLGPLRADLLVQPHDRVLVSCETPLAQGMVSVDIAAYFLMCQPVDGLTVIDGSENEGVEGFMRRVPTDIAAWNPTVVLISHGVGEGRAGKEDRDYTYYHPTYLGQTIDALKKIGVHTILLGSTSVMGAPASDATKIYNDNLAAFRDEDRDIAAKAGVPFVDVFAATSDAMNKARAVFGDSYALASNGHDLNRCGQLVVAASFLKALGADGNIGTITVDMAAHTATGTPGQKIVSTQNGTVNIESTRYPYCFTTSPPYDPAEETAKFVAVTTFNQDLNRYLLVVKGLTALKARVTWGTATQEFSASDLAQGVNLAAAFAGRTPFDTMFNRIVDQVWQRQLKQFVWNDGTISHLADIRTMAPGAPIDQLIAGLQAQDAKNGEALKALVAPIAHTIKIEPEP